MPNTLLWNIQVNWSLIHHFFWFSPTPSVFFTPSYAPWAMFTTCSPVYNQSSQTKTKIQTQSQRQVKKQTKKWWLSNLLKNASGFFLLFLSLTLGRICGICSLVCRLVGFVFCRVCGIGGLICGLVGCVFYCTCSILDFGLHPIWYMLITQDCEKYLSES